MRLYLMTNFCERALWIWKLIKAQISWNYVILLFYVKILKSKDPLFYIWKDLFFFSHSSSKNKTKTNKTSRSYFLKVSSVLMKIDSHFIYPENSHQTNTFWKRHETDFPWSLIISYLDYCLITAMIVDNWLRDSLVPSYLLLLYLDRSKVPQIPPLFMVRPWKTHLIHSEIQQIQLNIWSVYSNKKLCKIIL